MQSDRPQPVNIVVIFHPSDPVTEQLALAAGVGAIQAHANIRLRRIESKDDPAAHSLTAEQRERIAADYILPRDVDLEWADGVLLACASSAPSAMEEYLGSLVAGKYRGKLAAILSCGEHSGADSGLIEKLGDAARRVGFRPAASAKLSSIDAAKFAGRDATEEARSQKASAPNL